VEERKVRVQFVDFVLKEGAVEWERLFRQC
jgi:hypothetical protein